MAGVNLFDLAATISADTRQFDSRIKATQVAIQQTRDRLKELAKEGSAPFRTAQIDALRERIKQLSERYKTLTASQKQSATSMRDDLGGALQSIAPRFAAFAGSGGPLALAAAGFVASAAAAALLAKGLIDLTVQTADWQGKLFDMSQQLGVSVETLSGLEVVAATTGGNLDSMAQSLVIFQRNMEEANDPTSKAGKLFKELGVTSAETDQAIRQAVVGLSKMTDSYKQVNAAAEAFGTRGAKAWVAITKETSGSLDKLIDKLRAMGVLLSGDAAKAADEFNDQLTILQYQLRGVGAVIGQEMLPPILGALRSLSRLIEENQAAIRLMADAVRVLIAQPLEAWIRGNFYWLNQFAEALNYVTSREWSVTFKVVTIGGIPVPLPSGIMGTPKADPGSVISSGLGTPRKLGGGGGGGGGGRGGGAKQIDEVAEALKRYDREIDEAIRLSDRYDKDINRLTESLAKQKKVLDDTQRAKLMERIETLRTLEAGEAYRDFMKGLKEQLDDAQHSGDQWDKELRNIEKTLAKSKRTLEDFVGAEQIDIIAKLRLIELSKREAQAMQELIIVRQRYADILRNTRPRRATVPENEDVYIDEAGRIIDRRPKGETPEDLADKTRPRRALPDPWLEQYEKMRRLAESLTSLISSSLETGFREGMKAGLKEFALGILAMLQAKILDRLTDAIADALMKGMSKGQTAGAGGGILGTILGTVLGGLGGVLGGGGGGWGKVGGSIGFPKVPVGFADGGFMRPSSWAVVGERGPELIKAGSQGATVLPNHALAPNVSITVYARDAQSFAGRDTQQQITAQMRRVMQQAAVRVN